MYNFNSLATNYGHKQQQQINNYTDYAAIYAIFPTSLSTLISKLLIYQVDLKLSYIGTL